MILFSFTTYLLKLGIMLISLLAPQNYYILKYHYNYDENNVRQGQGSNPAITNDKVHIAIFSSYRQKIQKKIEHNKRPGIGPFKIRQFWLFRIWPVRVISNSKFRHNLS